MSVSRISSIHGNMWELADARMLYFSIIGSQVKVFNYMFRNLHGIKTTTRDLVSIKKELNVFNVTCASFILTIIYRKKWKK